MLIENGDFFIGLLKGDEGSCPGADWGFLNGGYEGDFFY